MSKCVQLALLLVVVRYCDRVTCAPIPFMLSLNSTCPEGIADAMLSPSNFATSFLSSNLINVVDSCTYPPRRGSRSRNSCQVGSDFESSAKYCCYSNDAVDSTLTVTKAEGNIPDQVSCECHYEHDVSKLHICFLLIMSKVL